MIPGTFDREGQKGGKKNSEDRMQETEVSRRPRTGIMEGWNVGSMGKSEYNGGHHWLKALLELTRLRRRQPEAGKRRPGQCCATVDKR
jgi:hypothetical protein